LSDPGIKRIPWDEIIVGAPIGRGASGLVSKGEWLKKPKGLVYFEFYSFLFQLKQKYIHILIHISNDSNSKRNSVKPQEIALKEMICGLSEFSPEVLEEFLKEIKLMRYFIRVSHEIEVLQKY
jgi:hypothetical protein